MPPSLRSWIRYTSEMATEGSNEISPATSHQLTLRHVPDDFNIQDRSKPSVTFERRVVFAEKASECE